MFSCSKHHLVRVNHLSTKQKPKKKIVFLQIYLNYLFSLFIMLNNKINIINFRKVTK